MVDAELEDLVAPVQEKGDGEASDEEGGKEREPPKRRPYDPLFVEETAIVRMYGTRAENVRFDKLMKKRENRWIRIEIVLLVEHVKERNRLGLGTQCCDECPNYETCRINWRRGELDLARTCCSNCPYYRRCSRQLKRAGAAAGKEQEAGTGAAAPKPEPPWASCPVPPAPAEPDESDEDPVPTAEPLDPLEPSDDGDA